MTGDLSLTPADREQIRKALTALLRPLHDESADAWRREVNRALKELLGADIATFHLALPGLEPLFSEEVDVGKLRTYPTYLKEWQERLGLERRMREMGVWTRAKIWGEHIGLLRRSDYWTEFVVATNAYDSLAATVPLPPDGQATTIYFHHESPRGRRFGTRGEALLELLFPAFAAGVTTRVMLQEARLRLATMLDTIDQPMQLATADGKVLHRNPPLRDLLRRATREEELERVMERLARDLEEHLKGPRDLVHTVATAPVSRTVSTGDVAYRVRGTLAPEHLAAGTTVLVSVRPLERELLGVAEIRARFRLTEREAQVALLLAERLTNPEIADRLHISPHTARRHTERVLYKLDVRSRRDVAGRLTGSPEDCP